MKLNLLRPARSLVLLGCLLVTGFSQVRAQTTATPAPGPVAARLDVFFGETKLLPLDRPIDDFTVTPDNIVRISKVDGSPNELSIVGLAGGSSTLTVKSDGRTLLYDIAVSPAPERLYINLSESKRLTFADPIDDNSVSDPGIVRIVEPDTANNVILVEAVSAGKTTLTVYSKGQIYRYFISTFENRGADILEIENAFQAKGYRNLSIAFDKDQAILSGTVPTQEELDDAVRIVKQFTSYVQVKAQLGQEIEQSEYTEEESIIINNIQRIANVPGLTIRVKFPSPTIVTTSTSTKSTGDYIGPAVTTTPQGGTTRSSGFNPPTDPNQAGGNPNAPLEAKPQQNVTETTTMTKNSTIPEKIFLYGDIQDDLQEAKIIRVARTFCPFIVNFLTIRDPIQLRTSIRFMQVSHTYNKDTGVNWSGGGPEGGPTVTIGFGQSAFSYLAQLSPANILTDALTGTFGALGTLDATAALELYENLNVAKLMRQTELFLTNGQPGWYSEGEVRSYVSSSQITASSPPIETVSASSLFLGVNMDISPLNLVQAGGTEPTGQKIYGIPGSVGSGGSSFTLEQNTQPTADNVSKLAGPVQISEGGGVPFVDNTVKYVDENGLIGMNISAQLSIPNGVFQQVTFGSGQFIQLPDFFVRTTRTRINIRDGQSIALDGLMDEQTTNAVKSVPFFSKIPIFSSLFKNPIDFDSREEVIVLVTPHIVRMKDPDSMRYPHPKYPEMHDLAREMGDVPIIKPVRYDAQMVDLRPETPKDMKDDDSKSAPVETAEPPPLMPRASSSMQTLQPPTDLPPAPSRPVDNSTPATDNSRQPSTPPPAMATPSTLP